MPNITILTWTHRDVSFLNEAASTKRFGHAAMILPLQTGKCMYISFWGNRFNSRLADFQHFDKSNKATLSIYELQVTATQIDQMITEFRSVFGDYSEEYKGASDDEYGCDKEVEKETIFCPKKLEEQSNYNSFTVVGIPRFGENCTSLVDRLLQSAGCQLSLVKQQKALLGKLLICSMLAGFAGGYSFGDFLRACMAKDENKDISANISTIAISLLALHGGAVILSTGFRMCSLDQPVQEKIFVGSIMFQMILAMASFSIEMLDKDMKKLTDASGTKPYNYGIGFGVFTGVVYTVIVALQLAIYGVYRPATLKHQLQIESQKQDASMKCLNLIEISAWRDEWLELSQDVGQRLRTNSTQPILEDGLGLTTVRL